MYIMYINCISCILTCTPKIGCWTCSPTRYMDIWWYLDIWIPDFSSGWIGSFHPQHNNQPMGKKQDAFSDNGCKHLQAGMHQKQKFTNQFNFAIWVNIIVVHFNWIEPSNLVKKALFTHWDFYFWLEKTAPKDIQIMESCKPGHPTIITPQREHKDSAVFGQ